MASSDDLIEIDWRGRLLETLGVSAASVAAALTASALGAVAALVLGPGALASMVGVLAYTTCLGYLWARQENKEEQIHGTGVGVLSGAVALAVAAVSPVLGYASGCFILGAFLLGRGHRRDLERLRRSLGPIPAGVAREIRRHAGTPLLLALRHGMLAGALGSLGIWVAAATAFPAATAATGWLKMAGLVELGAVFGLLLGSAGLIDGLQRRIHPGIAAMEAISGALLETQRGLAEEALLRYRELRRSARELCLAGAFGRVVNPALLGEVEKLGDAVFGRLVGLISRVAEVDRALTILVQAESASPGELQALRLKANREADEAATVSIQRRLASGEARQRSIQRATARREQLLDTIRHHLDALDGAVLALINASVAESTGPHAELNDSVEALKQVGRELSDGADAFGEVEL
ncbi:MAG: hypothetical protein HYV63_31260 [Candidatus Schekmanbacteria bacterium]|nr:hypothetical protein [Candidatus Schekmanbacteria bacterium]